MTIAVFDTLKLAKRLAAAGMSPAQAEGLAEGLSEVMTTELATKSDLKELRGWATAGFADVRTAFAKVREEMRTGHAQLRLEIAQSKNETVRWMIGLSVAQMTVTLGTLLRLIG